MYAAIRRYELGAGSVGDFMRIVDAGYVDALSRLPGFVAHHVIAGRGDEIVAVSLFRDEESARRSDQTAAEFVGERLQQFQLNLTSALSGEVGVSRGGALPGGASDVG